jgi:hypothetical protein
MPLKGQPVGSEPALWVLGEVDPKARGGEDWAQGGEAEVSITTEGGTAIARYTVPVPADTNRFFSRFPRNAEDVWLDPGPYIVRVRAKPASGPIPTSDTSRLEVPEAPEAEKVVMGQAVYARRGTGANAEDLFTADRRFRRTEKAVVQGSVAGAIDGVTAELLDRNGKVLPLPVTATTFDKDFVRWLRAEVALAPLAAGDYVIRVTAQKGNEQIQSLAPFRIIP